MYAVQWKSDKAFLGLPSLIKAAFEKACGDFEVPMGFMESALGCHAVSNPVMSGYQVFNCFIPNWMLDFLIDVASFSCPHTPYRLLK